MRKFLKIKIYERYLVREIFPYTMVGLATISFIILVNHLVVMAGFLIKNSASIWTLLKLTSFLMPATLVISLPMSILMGTILGIGRLSADSEITAFRACGISLGKFTKPVILFSLAMTFVTMLIYIYMLPSANEQVSTLIKKIISKKSMSSQVKQRVFLEDIPDKVLYISRLKNRNQLWENVLIFDTSKGDEPSIMMAQQAVPLESERAEGLKLQLKNVKIYDINPRAHLSQPRISYTNNMIMVLLESDEFTDLKTIQEKSDRSMTISELRKEIKKRTSTANIEFLISNNTDRKREITVKLDVLKKENMGKTDSFTSKFEIEPNVEKKFNMEYLPASRKRFAGLAIKFTLKTKKGEKVIYEGKEDERRIREIYYSGKSKTRTHNENWGTKLFADSAQNKRIEIKEIKLSELQYYKSPASLQVEIHKRFAIPLSCLIFGLLGLPLGISARKAGKSFGYLTSIIIFVSFYYLILNGEILADKEKISPFFGAWGANIIFSILSIIMLICMKKELEPRLIEKLSRAYRSAGSSLKKTFLRRKILSSEISTTPDEGKNDKKSGSPLAPGTFSSVKSQTAKPADPSRQKTGVVLQIPKFYFRFPNLLDRYIISTFIKLFLLVLLILYCISIVVQFTEVNDDIQKNNISYSVLWDYYKYRLPDTMLLLIPISALIATLATFGIFSRNNETIAIKAAGVSQYRMGLPVIMISILLSFVTFIISENVLPYSKIKYDEILRRIKKLEAQTMKQHGRQFLRGEKTSDNANRIYYFYGYDEKENSFERISFFDYDPIKMKLIRRLSANGAVWDKEFKGWEFHKGWIQSFNYPGVSTERFVKRILRLEEDPEYFKRSWRTPDQMSFMELKRLINELETKGYDPVRERVRLFWKIAYATVTLVVVLIALPFSFSMSNRGSLTGIFISLIIVLVYYPLSNVFKNLGYYGVFPSLIAAWGVNLLFILFALIMFFRMKT